MFNLKYNFLVIMQIILGIVNYILLLRVFGVSTQSDAYLLAVSVLAVFFIFITLPIGQFMQYYNDLKVISVKQSHDFYNISILFSLVLGIGFCIILNLFMPLVIKLFAFNIDAERFILLKNMVRILSIGLIFYPLNQINEQLFNAEMKFGLPYILSIIPLLLITITQIIMIYTNCANIEYLAIAQSIGLFGIALFGSIYISKTLIKFRIVRWQKQLTNEIKNSFIIKIGDLGWGIAIPILFNNFLVMFPKGYVSYFYYAKKILDIANNFTIGPSSRIIRSKISKFLAQKDVNSIKKISKIFLLYGGIIFIVVLVGAYFLQGPILKLITSNKLTAEDLKLILLIFLTLCPWYFIIFLETPFVSITHLSKKAKETLLVNVLFLIIFAPLLFMMKPVSGILSLGFSTSIAQISNLICYILISTNVIKKLKCEI